MTIYNKPLGLYIGCGTDVNIMTELSHDISQCIYIDSQPLTRYGELVTNNECVDTKNAWIFFFNDELGTRGYGEIGSNEILGRHTRAVRTIK